MTETQAELPPLRGEPAAVRIRAEYRPLLAQVPAPRRHLDADHRPAVGPRFVCDSPLTVITTRHGMPVEANTVTRRASTTQRQALATVYNTCGQPGCDVPFDDCHIHHIHPWTDTRTTNPADLIPTCTACHHIIHEAG